MLLTLSLVSCQAERVLGLSPSQARARIKRGDYGFVLSASPAELSALGRLGSPPAFFSALRLIKASGNGNARARVVLEAALPRASGVYRTEMLRLLASLGPEPAPVTGDPESDESRIALARQAIAQRSYGVALARLRPLLESGSARFLEDLPLLADLGKSFQYSDAVREGAALFLRWESELALLGDSDERNAPRFFLLFYAARMQRQTGQYSAARQTLERAQPLAPDPVQRDACRWYRLDTALQLSPAAAARLLLDEPEPWQNRREFASLLERLSSALVSNNDWTTIAALYASLRQRADAVTLARLGYLCARAVELGHLGPEDLAWFGSFADRQELARALYAAVLAGEAGFSSYRILSAVRLGTTLDPVGATLVPETQASSESSGGADAGSAGQAAFDARREFAFLLAFFDYGCADLLYAYVAARAARLELPKVRQIAERFARMGRWPDTIRCASLIVYRPGYAATREDLRLLYPRPFQAELHAASGAWQLPEELFYALVRTESAFNPEVRSHAGAVGLAQLMPETGLDVARRIRKDVKLSFITGADGRELPDLQDPVTNAQLGAWYLSDQIRRLGSPLLALLAYNAGPTRVRRWRADAPLLDEDIFLEGIPYAETREYGRKLLAASAVYGYLYLDLSLEQAVADLFPSLWRD